MREYMVPLDSPLWGQLDGFFGQSGSVAVELLRKVAQDTSKALQMDLRGLTALMVQDAHTNVLAAAVFPHLMEQAVLHSSVNDRINIMSLLGIVKPLMQVVDLYQADEQIYRGYWEGVYELGRMTKRYLKPEACAEMRPEDRPYLGRLYFLLVSLSKDTLPFMLYSPFDAAFHIQCLGCGCDLYSMHVTPDSMGAIPDIVPCDDLTESTAVHQWLADVLERMEEHCYIKILPYLYGSNTCPICKESYRVIDLAISYIEHQLGPLVKPGMEELQRLAGYAQEAAAALDGEKELFYRMLYNELQSRLD